MTFVEWGSIEHNLLSTFVYEVNKTNVATNNTEYTFQFLLSISYQNSMTNIIITYYTRVLSCANIYLNGTMNRQNEYTHLQIICFMDNI